VRFTALLTVDQYERPTGEVPLPALWRQMRPQGFDHLLAVLPMARRQREQLDQASGTTMAPSGGRHRTAVDHDLEPPEQVDLKSPARMSRSGINP